MRKIATGHPGLKPDDKPLLAILLMIVAVAIFSVMDVAMKLLVERYPAIQVTFLRCAGSLPVFVMAILFSRNRHQFITAQPLLQLVRGVIGIVMLTTVALCFRHMPLADAYTIFFAAPLVIALLSGPALGEYAGKHRLWAAAIGFVGVLIILKPGGGTGLSFGALMGLVGMLCYAVTTLIMRRLGQTDSALTIAFYFTLFAGIGSAAFALPAWQQVAVDDYGLIAILALSGTVAQILITAAFRRAPPATLAPFDYTALLWALLFGLWFWGDWPASGIFIGAAIIILSGLYILHREHRKQRRAPVVEETECR